MDLPDKIYDYKKRVYHQRIEESKMPHDGVAIEIKVYEKGTHIETVEFDSIGTQEYLKRLHNEPYCDITEIIGDMSRKTIEMLLKYETYIAEGITP